MSKLKAFDIVVSEEGYGEGIVKYRRAVYDKSEADKVIAELKAQKAQAEDDCAYWKTMSRKRADDNEVMAKQRADAFKRERHHKYKRCLAMAKICENGLGTVVKPGWWDKWRKYWLGLAKKIQGDEVMICCDKCQNKQEASHRVGWSDNLTTLNLTDSMVLCDKCYEQFMTLFGNFKGAKFPK